MKNTLSPLSGYEEIILNLRSLFGRYGYSCCRVSTFEEYDFYVRNRSALSGEDVLVFSDADGRLMALKPDVTMSIVKNVQDGTAGLRKLCYNENVYRIPTGGAGFRETVQTGLECIGQLDAYAIGEVLMLAARSLGTIRSNYILNLSHVGILDGLLDQALGAETDRAPIRKAMEQKNLAALSQLCSRFGVLPQYRKALEMLSSLYGPLRDALPEVEKIAEGEKMENACRELREIRDLMEVYGLGEQIHLDFSIGGGTDYYSGLIFRGFVDNAASPVLWGGQYDRLIHRMGKRAGGIGFAVYLDQLERGRKTTADEEILLLYDREVPPEQVIRTVAALGKDGARVRAERQIPPDSRFDRLMKLSRGGVTEIG